MQKIVTKEVGEIRIEEYNEQGLKIGVQFSNDNGVKYEYHLTDP